MKNALWSALCTIIICATAIFVSNLGGHYLQSTGDVVGLMILAGLMYCLIYAFLSRKL